MIDRRKFVEELTPFVSRAGETIMDIYHHEVQARTKEDGSPVTLADERAEAILLDGLKKCLPNTLVVSEENVASHNEPAPEVFCLVDPLDGTREFLKSDGKGSFTVNIALIESGYPVAGLVFAPALDRLFTGIVGEGAFENGRLISTRDAPLDGSVGLVSVSHTDKTTSDWLVESGIEKTIGIGSSLKFCLIAAGEADVYPRLSSIMEWDIAAGDAILRAAGGLMQTPDGEAVVYGKPGYKSGVFVASGK